MLLPFLRRRRGGIEQVPAGHPDAADPANYGFLRQEDTKVPIERVAHTLKGSARMAGAIRLGELTHLMESRIEFALEAGDMSPVVFEELQALFGV